MTNTLEYEYARDDFNYPRFLERFLRRLLNYTMDRVRAADIGEQRFRQINMLVIGISAFLILIGAYFMAGVVVAISIFLDQISLHLFTDRSVPKVRFRHFIEQETLLIVALAIHMWMQGHFWTGLAALIGLCGLYLLTNLQMKYDLMAIQIPRLYFLRWDRMGIVALFSLLAAWPGERAYLFAVLLAWFLAALSFYDYIWILIQLAKKKS